MTLKHGALWTWSTLYTYTHPHTQACNGILFLRVWHVLNPQGPSLALPPSLHVRFFLSSIALFIMLYTWGRIFHLSPSHPHPLPLRGLYGPCSGSLSTWEPNPWGKLHTALEKTLVLDTHIHSQTHTHKCQLPSWVTDHKPSPSDLLTYKRLFHHEKTSWTALKCSVV